MPISFEYKKNSNLIESKISGVLHFEEIAEYFIKLNNEIALAPNFVEIVDFNDADDLVLTFTALNKLSELYQELTAKGHQITLFCAYNNHAQGILDMMMPLFHTMKINVLVCKSEQELKTNISIFKSFMANNSFKPVREKASGT